MEKRGAGSATASAPAPRRKCAPSPFVVSLVHTLSPLLWVEGCLRKYFPITNTFQIIHTLETNTTKCRSLLYISLIFLQFFPGPQLGIPHTLLLFLGRIFLNLNLPFTMFRLLRHKKTSNRGQPLPQQRLSNEEKCSVHRRKPIRELARAASPLSVIPGDTSGIFGTSGERRRTEKYERSPPPFPFPLPPAVHISAHNPP